MQMRHQRPSINKYNIKFKNQCTIIYQTSRYTTDCMTDDFSV